MSEVIQYKSVDEWASEINSCWQNTVLGILETGRLISEALAEIPHGQKAEFYDRLAFSEQTAKKLRQVAKDKRISNRAHVRVLPPSWGTLYELTKLDDDTWAIAEEEGKIFPDMQRKDVAAISRNGPIVPDSNVSALNKAAQIIGVSSRSISDARRIKDEDPEAFERLKRGEDTISAVKRRNAFIDDTVTTLQGFAAGIKLLENRTGRIDLDSERIGQIREALKTIDWLLKEIVTGDSTP